MRSLRYSINFTLDGCCDHLEITPDEELHRHAVENLSRADALVIRLPHAPAASAGSPCKVLKLPV